MMLLSWDTSGPIRWQWRFFCSLGGFFRNLKMILCFLGGGTQESKSFALGLLEIGLFKTKHKEISNSAGFLVWNILERRGSRWVLVPSESFTRNHMEPENGTHEDEIPSKTAFLSKGRWLFHCHCYMAGRRNSREKEKTPEYEVENTSSCYVRPGKGEVARI